MPEPSADPGDAGLHRQLGFLAAAQDQPAVLVEAFRVRVIELPGRVRAARTQGRDYIG